jgi:hypothetical protein
MTAINNFLTFIRLEYSICICHTVLVFDFNDKGLVYGLVVGTPTSCGNRCGFMAKGSHSCFVNGGI